MRRFNLMVMVLLTALLMCSSPAWSLDRFINLNDGTMLDSVFNLRWLQNANCYDKQNIGNANSLSANLTTGLCGLADSSAAGDWHLPTIDELSTLIAAPDSYRTATLITAGFTNVANTSSYRSSTIQSSGYTTYFWDMQMYDGVAINNPDSYQRYVWPVRPGQNWRLNSLAIVGTAGFGAQAVGSVSSAHQFILKNFGSDPLPVTAIALGGTNLDQFTLTTGGSLPCLSLSPTLAAGASCTVLVAATPTSVGSKNATLTVTTASGTSDVPLTGIAYMPVVYAVSPASGPTTGATPVVISGANLTGATGVRFGNNGAGYIISSDSQIIAYSPAASAGTVDITIITPGAVSAVNSADQFTYTRVNQTVAFGPAPLIGVGGKGVVSTTVNSGLAVALSSLTPSVCTISGTTVTGVAAGMCSIAANQSGDGTYNAAVTQTLSFTINAAQEPIGVTAAATAITPTSATLNGIVNANYSSADVSFEYGTTTAYGSSATASQSPVAGYSDTTVSAVVTLNPNTLYHFRIKVVNAVTGTFYGNDLTFTTPLPRFVNLKDGTMLDSVNSLRWLQNVDCNPGANWADAQAWSNNLASGTCGLSDGSAVAAWHLPTKDELYSLVDYPDLYRGVIGYSIFGNSFQDAGFIYSVNASQWTSTTDPSDSNSAWGVYTYKTANVASNPKSAPKGVWPVRGGQCWTVGSLFVTGTTDFGAQALGMASSAHQFTLHNIGSTPQSVTSIASGGTNADQFILTTGGISPCLSLSPTLAGGTNCTVIITAKPTSVGSKSALLAVSTAGGSVNVPLSTSTSASVTYNGNGNSSGTVPDDSAVYSYGTPATVLGNSGSLVKSGYLFNGWNTAANGSGTGYAVGATVTFVGATTLYASWTPSPLPSGLVSWWRGEGNGIDTAGGLTGTPSAGMAYTSGKVGQAFSLNGSTAYVTVPDNPKLSFGTNEFSIAAWIKTTDTLDWQRVVNKRAATGSANWYSLFIHQGSVWFEIAGSGLNFSSNAFVADGAWHQIAVTRDPAATTPRLYRLYVDGVEKNSWADGGLNLDNTGPLEIGKWSTNTPYSGLIDEVQMFNRSLAASEILAIYNAGSAGLALAPTVTTISPSAGPARTAVVISGSNLTGASVVKFGTNTAPSFTFDSDSQITAVAPDGIAATVADITVTTPGGVSAVSSVDRFTFIIADQVITFGPVPVVIGVGGNALVSATASSGLGVSFSSPTNSVCTISGTTVTGISTGTCTITANQPGSGAYNAAVQQTQDITIIAATAPTVATATATAISPTGTTATLNGTVNPNFSSADISFEYGTTTSYGSTATASQSPVSGGTATAVSAAISALNPGTRYHYRIKAVNAVTGTVYGDDATFTPLPRFVNLLDGTILDTSSSVRWLKNAYCYQQQIWETAMWTAAGLSSSYCGLTDGSIAGDWHLPTRDEFVSLVAVPDKHDYITLLASGFINTKNTAAWGVWLSTDINNDYAYKALTRPYSDDSYWLWPTPKSAISMVWPVRSGQYAILNSLVMTGKTDFGAQPLGTAATTQFTLKNIGTASLTVTSMALGGANADQFTLSSGGALPCASLAPTLASGEVCTLLVTSQLTTVGSKSAALTVAIASESMTMPLAARSQSSVTYNGNGNSAGSVPSDSAEYADGSTVVVLGNSGSLVKSGYPFNGWNTAADGSGTGYAVGATFTITAPVTLYAMWPAKITPPAGLVSWWRGEGNAIDTLGTNNGTLHSDTTFAFANGKAGQAFSFSGETTEYVTAAYNPTLNFGAGPFSMAVWVNTNDAAGVWKRIVTKGGTSGSSNWYSLVLNSGKVTFEIAGGSDVSSTVSVANGVWHHIAVTRDPVGVSPRKFHLYIDGVENVSMNDSGASLDNTGPLEIGKWGNEAYGGTIYSGLIDEVQLFNRALSSTEIQSIYSAGLAAPPVVTGISPSSGSAVGGTSVVITGNDLTEVSAVKFGNSSATGVMPNSDTLFNAISPPAVAGLITHITVTTAGGTTTTSSADQFTYTQDQAWNDTTKTSYATLAAALSSALSGAEIRSYDSQFDGVFTLDKGLALIGGYNAAFDAKGSQPTTLNGSLTVTGGASKIEDLLVKGKLTVKGGSLRVNGVNGVKVR